MGAGAWSCPLPLRDHERIVTGHGGGGRLSSELIEHLFRPAFGGDVDDPSHDSVVLPVPTGGARLAFSTDAYVVTPVIFPGGSIGDLAVNGTVNDIAMSGAIPLVLSAAFVLEEGLELATLGRIAEDMGRAAEAAEVRLVTGDTKVVEARDRGGLTITTAGFGVIPDGVELGPKRVRPGDQVLLSGPIGEHGMAIMSLREGLEFESQLRTDSAPLAGLVQTMLAAAPGGGVRALRDATRGGFASVLCELAEAGGTGIEYVERDVPVPSDVAAACSFLGLDPTHVANEGKLVAVVAPEVAEEVLVAMRSHPQGRGAVRVGEVVDDHHGIVVARTGIGAKRVVDLPLGEQLPRIC
ncbi:MAG: hydrogenase expression/formation protein HypE [Nitriliruptor sp.]|nr:MAG: hydrogenase expression/formation protein HypE [Nitriliruptor sp.]